jgi:sugar phosphate isomerase/epimerase
MAKIGVCTWTYGEQPLADIVKRVHQSGFDGVELFGNVRDYKPAQVNQLLKANDLQVFSLTPDNVDLAHPDPDERQAALDYYLELLDFAAQLGRPLVSCHGFVGRVRALSSLQLEERLLADAVDLLAQRAQMLDLRLVLEVLNRYESHLLNTASATRALVDRLGADNVGILLDTYHMNIDESDLPAALRTAGDRLWLFHVADSNRQGIGRGHTDFASLFDTLDSLDYEGPVILETTAPGPDPFTAIKDEHSLDWLATYHRESITWIRNAWSQREA